MAKATEPEIHAQTSAEIGRLTAEYVRERQEKAEARRQLYIHRADAPVQQPMPPDEVAAREFALEKLNGFAPAGMRVLETSDPDRRLSNEIRGLDMVLEILGRQDMAARAAEAYQHAAEGADEWRDLCRDLLLTAERLIALENRAHAFRQRLGGLNFTPADLPMARYIGLGGSLIDHRPSADPLGRMRDAALQARIVTPSDIRNARDE